MPDLKLENVSYQYKNGDRKVVNEVACLPVCLKGQVELGRRTFRQWRDDSALAPGWS